MNRGSAPAPRGSTGADLLLLWEWAATTGRMNEHTANQYRTACARVLDCIDADPATIDVSSINLDKAIQRFRNENQQLRSSTLGTYESAFRRAVPSLATFLSDSKSWRPPTSYTKRNTRSRTAVTTSAVVPQSPQASQVSNVAAKSNTPTEIEVPLPGGRAAKITLPNNASSTDMQFLAKFLTMYVTTEASG